METEDGRSVGKSERERKGTERERKKAREIQSKRLDKSGRVFDMERR